MRYGTVSAYIDFAMQDLNTVIDVGRAVTARALNLDRGADVNRRGEKEHHSTRRSISGSHDGRSSEAALNRRGNAGARIFLRADFDRWSIPSTEAGAKAGCVGLDEPLNGAPTWPGNTRVTSRRNIPARRGG